MAEWQRTHTCGELRRTSGRRSSSTAGSTPTAPTTIRSSSTCATATASPRWSSRPTHAETVRRRPGSPQRVGAGRRAARSASACPSKHNPKLATGDIEVKAEELDILNRCPTPPFEVMSIPQEGSPSATGTGRRGPAPAVSLSRPAPADACSGPWPCATGSTRSSATTSTRRASSKSKRRCWAAARRKGRATTWCRAASIPGEWYALPQSPQLYKQLLMVAGYDKYFQIARCLRDEDLRADRQPEFTQLDLEMSFVEMDDVFARHRGADRRGLPAAASASTIPLPLPRLQYADVMLRYGSDKPDLRYGLEIVDIGDLAAQTEFKVFQDALAAGGKVRGINAKGAAEQVLAQGARRTDGVRQAVRRQGAGLDQGRGGQVDRRHREVLAGRRPASSARSAWRPSPATCCCSSPTRKTSSARRWAPAHAPGRGCCKLVDPASAAIQDRLGRRLPLVHLGRGGKALGGQPPPVHRRRCDEDLAEAAKATRGSVRAKAYDLVINGYECGGGSIRIHNPEVQSRVFTRPRHDAGAGPASASASCSTR